MRLPNVLIPPLGILYSKLDTAVSYWGGMYARDSHDEKKPQPRLHVVCRLPDVIPSPFARDDAHLIGSETFHGDHFLAFREELGFHGGVGHED